MDNTNVTAGQEVLIKTPRSGRYRFYGWDIIATTVTRATKARIFVKHARLGAPDGELEFNKADLTERVGGRGFDHRRELVVDPAEIAKIREQQAADKARRALENDGAAAFVALEAKFSPETRQGYRPLESRTDDEIKALIAAVEALLGTVK